MSDCLHLCRVIYGDPSVRGQVLGLATCRRVMVSWRRWAEDRAIRSQRHGRIIDTVNTLRMNLALQALVKHTRRRRIAHAVVYIGVQHWRRRSVTAAVSALRQVRLQDCRVCASSCLSMSLGPWSWLPPRSLCLECRIVKPVCSGTTIF